MAKMNNTEYRRMMDLQRVTRMQHSFGRRIAQSKRTIKGRAKGFNVVLKRSRVHSPNVESLKWSPHSYKAMNNNFNVNRAS